MSSGCENINNSYLGVEIFKFFPSTDWNIVLASILASFSDHFGFNLATERRFGDDFVEVENLDEKKLCGALGLSPGKSG